VRPRSRRHRRLSERLDRTIEAHACFIIEEALTGLVEHAKADTAEIQAAAVDDVLWGLRAIPRDRRGMPARRLRLLGLEARVRVGPVRAPTPGGAESRESDGRDRWGIKRS
jgi:hypothetical protein